MNRQSVSVPRLIRHLSPLVALVLLLAASTGEAAGDARRGMQKNSACIGCHGIAGYRNASPVYGEPKLGNQFPDYLVAALTAYRRGQRPHPTMRAIAAGLSDQDMADLAAYYGTSQRVNPGSENIGPHQGQSGESVPQDMGGSAQPGAQKAQLCVACHGPGGRSINPQFPKLAGQVEDYLAYAMKAYRSGARKNAVMQGMAASLSDKDIADLAAYFNNQPGDLYVKY